MRRQYTERIDRSAGEITYVPLIFLISFCVIGGIFLAFGVGISAANNNAEKRCTLEVSATVVDLVPSSDGDAYAPIFYYSVDGKDYLKLHHISRYPPEFDIGEQVVLYCNPADVTDFIVPDSDSVNLLSTIFTVVGGVLIALGIIVAIIIRCCILLSRRRSYDPF